MDIGINQKLVFVALVFIIVIILFLWNHKKPQFESNKIYYRDVIPQSFKIPFESDQEVLIGPLP
jgi:nitrogen fixation-related uncharacterized protein